MFIRIGGRKLLNAFRIKIHSLLVRNKPKVFVNPYAIDSPPVHPKLNPYVSQYDTKTSKTLPGLTIPDIPIVVDIDFRSSFIEDMKEMFIGDLLWVAGKFKEKIPVKEKQMSYDEIQKVCENIKW